jgi:hypothetical protein
MSKSTTTTRRPRTAKAEAPVLSKRAIAEYLKAEATTDEVGTVEAPAPYIRPDGRVFIHSRSMLAWARAKHGNAVTQRDVQKVLRDAGLTVRARPLPGIGKSVGFYIGKPKGVKLTGITRRKPNGGNAAK